MTSSYLRFRRLETVAMQCCSFPINNLHLKMRENLRVISGSEVAHKDPRGCCRRDLHSGHHHATGHFTTRREFLIVITHEHAKSQTLKTDFNPFVLTSQPIFNNANRLRGFTTVRLKEAASETVRIYWEIKQRQQVQLKALRKELHNNYR